ncbi:unnamed protein product, partial [Owenia fusiformis]
HIYEEVASNSEQLWKATRYHLVIEYRDKPVFAPPLIVLALFWRMVVNICNWAHAFKEKSQEGHTDSDILKQFEADCLSNYIKRHRDEGEQKTDQMLKTILDLQRTIETERRERAEEEKQRYQRELLLQEKSPPPNSANVKSKSKPQLKNSNTIANKDPDPQLPKGPGKNSDRDEQITTGIVGNQISCNINPPLTLVDNAGKMSSGDDTDTDDDDNTSPKKSLI